MENLKESEVKDLAQFAKNGKITIEVLEGPAQKFLDPVDPIEKGILDLTGHVGTIYNFLSRRNHLFKPDECHIRVEANAMHFKGNECDDHNEYATIIRSKITETGKFQNLAVNSDKSFEALELAGYLRRRKNMFINPEQFDKVFTALSSFKAEIKRQVETANDKTGNYVNSIQQTVTHNMPRKFDLKVQIFEQTYPVQIEIEVDVNPNDLSCSLMSFDLDEKYETLRESLFEGELDQEIAEGKKIRDFCVVYYA